MADASPPKWHLAHTTWFFETFVLEHAIKNYRLFHPDYQYLFNSYYEGVGERHPRPDRGYLSRPLVREIYAYRDYVDIACRDLLVKTQDDELIDRVVLGTHHEQQHQELILTDLKFNLGHNPLRPAYFKKGMAESDLDTPPLTFTTYEGGTFEIGATSEDEFCFDNELPCHVALINPFKISNRLITNGEFLAFIEDGGYTEPGLWLSDGWQEKQIRHWGAPEYWYQKDGEWWEYTLHGTGPVNSSTPVCHVSYYEADAFARWQSARLPTEQEWELATRTSHAHGSGHFADAECFHPVIESTTTSGNCWQWTSSSYTPYPGFRPLPGTLGEYNGKFMANQFVLRGGSCATPRSHYRHTYRNFFYPKDRWQFSGIRLAKNIDD